MNRWDTAHLLLLPSFLQNSISFKRHSGSAECYRRDAWRGVNVDLGEIQHARCHRGPDVRVFDLFVWIMGMLRYEFAV
ncbi:hypothetical protein Hypma_008308 [Hypsizygus marmoreus]|uniref:Uncharacterized protein n=1 Tax=Hypsizygus marmoreus TaxID=39966 RepID=A0A369JQH7_HYPMA|nr:hypothetical protein Hypma_008308 [Hypsizygus marmoreus]